MSLARIYTVDSGLIGVTGTAQTPLLMTATNSTTRVAVQAFRIGCHSGSGVSYPSNASVLTYFARPTNTPAGGTSAVPTPHGGQSGAQAANSTWTVGSWSTAPLCPSPLAGGILCGIPIAFAAGANYSEWVTPQSEWEIGPNSFGAFFITCSSAGTATDFMVEAVFGE